MAVISPAVDATLMATYSPHCCVVVVVVASCLSEPSTRVIALLSAHSWSASTYSTPHCCRWLTVLLLLTPPTPHCCRGCDFTAQVIYHVFLFFTTLARLLLISWTAAGLWTVLSVISSSWQRLVWLQFSCFLHTEPLGCNRIVQGSHGWSHDF